MRFRVGTDLVISTAIAAVVAAVAYVVALDETCAVSLAFALAVFTAGSAVFAFALRVRSTSRTCIFLPRPQAVAVTVLPSVAPVASAILSIVISVVAAVLPVIPPVVPAVLTAFLLPHRLCANIRSGQKRETKKSSGRDS